MDLDFPCDQIGLRRQDVAVLANPRDITRALEIAQRLLERAAVVALHPKRAGEFDFVERPVFRRAHQAEDFSFEVTLFFHRSFPIIRETGTIESGLLLFVRQRSNKQRAVIVSQLMTAATWKVEGNVVDLTSRGMIMGVLNVTPDSFSDGGEFFATEAAVEHGLTMTHNGADIIDVGGESTRPGAEPVPADEEIGRVMPVIQALAQAAQVRLSIDTSKADVARAALDAGATIINDVTGGRGDTGMFAVAAEKGAALIIMHMQGTPRTMQANPSYQDVVAEVADFFRQQYELAVRSGIDPMCLAFDPGIGFGKTVAHNLALLAHLEDLRIDDRPLVVGVSRKSFLGKLATAPVEKANATVAMTSLLRERGAQILRVHDVAENADALRTTEALLAAAQ